MCFIFTLQEINWFLIFFNTLFKSSISLISELEIAFQMLFLEFFMAIRSNTAGEQ